MIGIDLGNKFLKVCKILNFGQKKKELSVVSAMVDFTKLSNADKLATFISMLKKMGCIEESVYLAVGGGDIINREVSVRKKIVKNLKEQIINDIEGSVSEDLKKMYTSYTIIKNISEKDHNIIFSAVPMDKVNAKFSFVNSVETLSVVGVTLEDLALANAFNEFGPNYKNTENIVLINIGYNVTNIVVLSNKELVFVKDIDFGGQDITTAIANLYSIPEKLAEEIKRREDFKQDIDFNMKNILKKSMATLIETLFRTIEYCVTRQFIVSVDRIVLTGGGSLIVGMDSFIEETLGVPTEKWNPLETVKVVGYINKLQGYFLPVALGLALEKEKR